MNDHALDALLAEYVAPPVPAGLAMRVAAAAVALPQETRRETARREAARPRHDRRTNWLRRPILAGGVALGLAISGAVAASLAGVRIDWPAAVESLLNELPFFGRETPPEPLPPSVTIPADPPPPTVAPPLPRNAEDVAPSVAPVPEPRAAAPPAAPSPPAAAPSDVAEPRPPELPPAPSPLPPPPVIREERAVQAPVPETRETAARADEDRARIERTERLRAARQAQIERLQRVQQRRERLRRVRRQ